MTRADSPARLVAALSAIVAGACWHQSTTAARRVEGAPAPLIESRIDSLHTEERQFRELAQYIPGHGGYFLDTEVGRLVLYLKNLGDSTAAVRLVRSRLAHLVSSRRPILVRRATYTWLQLKEWRDRLFPEIFSVPRVYWLDLDEERNRVVIGLDSTADSDRVRHLVKRLGIPQRAIELEESGPLEFDGARPRKPDERQEAGDFTRHALPVADTVRDPEFSVGGCRWK